MGSIFDHVTKGGLKPNQEPSRKPINPDPEKSKLFDAVTSKARKIKVSDELGGNSIEINESERIAFAQRLARRLLNMPMVTQTQNQTTKIQEQTEQPKPLQVIIAEQSGNKFNIKFENKIDSLLICNSEEEALRGGQACAEKLGAFFGGIKREEKKSSPVPATEHKPIFNDERQDLIDICEIRIGNQASGLLTEVFNNLANDGKLSLSKNPIDPAIYDKVINFLESRKEELAKRALSALNGG